MLKEAFEVHEELNPLIWNGSELREEVKERILTIVDAFKEQVTIPFTPLDILIVGSNASFNYSKYSDMDVHIVVNFDIYDSSNQILTAYYNLEKSKFNEADISIHGVEVELYVEDTQTNVTSNGIYSVMYDKWIKYPKPIEVKQFDVSALVDKWKIIIENALDSGDDEKVNDVINQLYLIRKQSILVDGEYGKGNYLFKGIRDLGLLDELKRKKLEFRDSRLTLEELKYKMDTSSVSDLFKMEM